MAKQKKNRLYCDEVADSNIRLINKCGKIVTAEELYPIIANDYVQHMSAKGVTCDEQMIMDNLTTTKSMLNMASLTALNNWYWGGRQVYRFDSELADLLRSQSRDDIIVDLAALDLLPVQHFFISLKNEAGYGFFVSISGDVLYISDMLKDRTEAYVMPLSRENATLSDIIDNANRDFGISVSKKDAAELSRRIAMYMQFVVYLSAVNAEITPVTKGAVTTRQARQNPITRHNKTEISEVGYRIGETIRASRKDKSDIKYTGEHAQSTTKVPHIRRSHFHSYWTGSGEDKELVVKWVNTIFVHGGNADISTVHDVK